MNRIYRSIWNEVTRTFVAAAENVRGRGKRSVSSRDGESGGVGALPDGALHKESIPGRRRLVFGGTRSLALEQRFMFDGAAVVDAVDTAQQNTDAAAAGSSAHLLDLTPIAAQTVPNALLTAQTQAEKLVSDFLNRDDAKQQLFALFNGGQSGEPSTEWNAGYAQLMSQFRNGDSPVRVELRSAAELRGSLGAFAAHGPDGTQLIYLNADYAKSATSDSLQVVLLEEIGHAIDNQLNLAGDTAGDEGQKFAATVLNLPVTAPDFATDNDHVQLQIDNHEVAVETAGTVFNANNQQLVFENKTTISGTGTGNGNIVRFNNVITIGGQAIDAVVTTTLAGATVSTYDGTSAGGPTSFFGPSLSITAPTNVGDVNGVRFKIDFYLGGTYTGIGTGTAVTLQNVVVNSYDM